MRLLKSNKLKGRQNVLFLFPNPILNDMFCNLAEDITRHRTIHGFYNLRTNSWISINCITFKTEAAPKVPNKLIHRSLFAYTNMSKQFMPP